MSEFMADDKLTLERAFCFTVVVWGQRFRNYLLEYCLPSLLAPGNIPSLAGQRPAKFIFTTTAEDWQLIQATAIFHTLKRYATPVFLELPQCPPDRPNWAHSVVGFKLYCDAVYREKAYRIFTAPDWIHSDGTIARLHQLACEGVQAVFVAIPPTAEESLFERLGEMGLSPSISARDTGIPLVYSSRQLVSAALNSLHSMAVVNEWATPYFCGYAAIPWWRVPGEEGIVLFGMVRNPILIDYSAVGQHDVSIIDIRGIDGDYDMRTVGHLKTIYTIRDSDEMYVVGHAPTSYQQSPLNRQMYGELGKGAMFRASYYGSQFNWLHRTMLFVPVRIHAGQLNEKWDFVEKKALQTLLTWLDGPVELGPLGKEHLAAASAYAAIEATIHECRLPWWRRNPAVWKVCCTLLLPGVQILRHSRPSLAAKMHLTRIAVHRVMLALRGDVVARRWWGWRLRKLRAQIAGREFCESRPQTPE